MSYTNYLITTTILMITTVYHLLNIIPIASDPIYEDTERYHICLPSNKNFTNSYNQSRALVVIAVISTTSLNHGFRNVSFTWFRNSSSSTLDDPNEWSYGLAQCRGDVLPDDCKKCVNNASIALIDTNASITLIDTNHCNISRSAIIWRDYCLFKYSDVDFFGKLDTANNFSMSTGEESEFSKDEILYFMNSLKKTAIEITTLYAIGSSNQYGITTYIELYGMVQCTRDLSKDNCRACLERAINQLPGFERSDYYYTGSRLLYGSCNVRYEIYPF